MFIGKIRKRSETKFWVVRVLTKAEFDQDWAACRIWWWHQDLAARFPTSDEQSVLLPITMLWWWEGWGGSWWSWWWQQWLHCLWWCKQAPGEVTTGKMTARCIKITADNSQPSSNDQEFLQCHQDLPIALSLSVLSNIALFSLTISLILFPGLLSMFGCFVHFLTLWSLRSQRRGQEVSDLIFVIFSPHKFRTKWHEFR